MARPPQLPYCISGNRRAAEDLVQESLTRAWRSIGKLKDVKAAEGWLYTIVRRENAGRFERYQPQQVDIPTEELCAKHETYDTSTDAFVLRRAIRELPAEYREPLLLQVIHSHFAKLVIMQSFLPEACTERGRKRPSARRGRRMLDIIAWVS